MIGVYTIYGDFSIYSTKTGKKILDYKNHKGTFLINGQIKGGLIKKNRLLQKNISLDISKEVLESIIDKKYNFSFGARPIKRLLQDKILNKISEEILSSGRDEGVFKITLKKDEVNFKFFPKKKNQKKLVLNKN